MDSKPNLVLIVRPPSPLRTADVAALKQLAGESLGASIDCFGVTDGVASAVTLILSDRPPPSVGPTSHVIPRLTPPPPSQPDLPKVAPPPSESLVSRRKPYTRERHGAHPCAVFETTLPTSKLDLEATMQKLGVDEAYIMRHRWKRSSLHYALKCGILARNRNRTDAS